FVVNILHTIVPFLELEISSFHTFIRKCAHFFAYLMLGLLVANALKVGRIKHVGLALFICVLYAISDEVHQLFIPGRSGEARDVFIDSLGSITGISIYYMIAQLKKIVSSTSNEEA